MTAEKTVSPIVVTGDGKREILAVTEKEVTVRLRQKKAKAVTVSIAELHRLANSKNLVYIRVGESILSAAKRFRELQKIREEDDHGLPSRGL